MRANKQFAKRWISAPLFLLLSLESACSLGQTAAHTACHRDTLQNSSGVYLPLASGQLYQVYPSGNTTSMMWRPLDKLIVCPIGGSAVTITNISEKDEQVRAIRVFNFFWLQYP